MARLANGVRSIRTVRTVPSGSTTVSVMPMTASREASGDQANGPEARYLDVCSVDPSVGRISTIPDCSLAIVSLESGDHASRVEEPVIAFDCGPNQCEPEPSAATSRMCG